MQMMTSATKGAGHQATVKIVTEMKMVLIRTWAHLYSSAPSNCVGTLGEH